MAKSNGLGDDLKKVFDATGISKVVEKTTELLGIEDCGCSGRQQFFNELVPYKQVDYPPMIPQDVNTFEEGFYIFNNNLVYSIDGVTFQYYTGDKLEIKLDNPHINNFKQYYSLGIITKINE